MPHRVTNQLDVCATCGGPLESGTTTISADLGAGLLVVREVPAHICHKCGAEWLDHSVSLRLDHYTKEMREEEEQVKIVSFRSGLQKKAEVLEVV